MTGQNTAVPGGRRGRITGKAALAAALTACLLASGCQTTNSLPSWMNGGKSESAPPAQPAPQTPAQTAPIQPPVAQPPAQAPVPPQPAMTSTGELLPVTLSTDPAADPTAVKIALLAPLSGPSAATGQSLLNAAQLALFDAGNTAVTLKPYDTRGSADGAAAAASAAVNDGAVLVLGPLFASSVTAVSPTLKAAHVRALAFSTDAQVASPGIYVSGILASEQARRLVAHARAQGILRFAALSPEGAFGRSMVAAYEQAVIASGGTMVKTLFHGPNDDLQTKLRAFTDFDTRAATLAAQKKTLEGKTDPASLEALARLQTQDATGPLPFEALLMTASGTPLKEELAVLSAFNADGRAVRLMGPMLWNDPALLRDPSLTRAWFPAVPQGPYKSFAQRYQQAFGDQPTVLSALGYDLTALASVLARQSGGRAYVDSVLTQSTGFAGANGLFRFRPDGSNERALAVMENTANGPVVSGEAAASFTATDAAKPAF
ncbi:penicillin-binding protein activator [Novispirillum itersonii]|uniref:penicillin-binding protein activator n=1 Tax=Novispirillum itersonii TaxID=189 RepID=UPI0003776158|nr:penicillin-binding protein activator [Novispirillum itersonii]